VPQDIVFDLPWTLRRSPLVEEVRPDTVAWMAKFGLLHDQGFTVDQFASWQLTELAGYFFPDADTEGLRLASDLMAWYFAPFDDQFDGSLGNNPAQVARICADLVTITDLPPRPGNSPTARALADLWQRSCAPMSQAWQRRAHLSWSSYLATHLSESVNRAHGYFPSPEECVRMRAQSTSTHVVIDLIERVNGFELPALVWHHPILVELRRLAAELLGISNDLCSVEKEEACGDTANNLVLALEREAGCTRRDAVVMLRKLTAERVHRFTSTQRRLHHLDCFLQRDERNNVRRFVHGLEALMRGDSEWEHTTGRYSPQAGETAAQRARASSSWQPLEAAQHRSAM
jgi:hypothetical protein